MGEYFTFIDLFAGIGGIRLGMQDFLDECVFSCEMDKFAKETYRDNFEPVDWDDIRTIPVESIPAHDVLLAGFPCQPFSKVGNRKGFDDIRGTLFFDIVRIIEHHKPNAFLLENVKGLLSNNKRATFDTIIKCLEGQGYNVHWTVLNAKDFGLAQNRERVYIVGFRYNVPFEWPTPPMTKTCVGHHLEDSDTVPPEYTITDKAWTGHQRHRKKHEARGNGFGYTLVYPTDTHTPTICARYYKDGSEALVWQENKNPRRLTVREIARLQGFPESFQFPCSKTQTYKQLGNSVPVNVIRAIGREMKKVLIHFDEFLQTDVTNEIYNS